MRLIFIIFTALILLFSGGVVKADECSFRDGGYCVSVFITTTSGIVEKKIPIDNIHRIQIKNNNYQLNGIASLNYYESLWSELINAKILTKDDQKAAFSKAEKSGGTKIGGVNLVVLAAETLNHLVKKDLLTQEEAQKILDDAKK